MNSRTPRHCNDMTSLFLRTLRKFIAQRVGTWILTFSIPSSVLSRFEIIKYKCDSIFFDTLDRVFDIIRICLRIFFSRCYSTLSRVFYWGFTTKRLHVIQMIRTIDCNDRQVLQTTSQLCRDFELTNRPRPLQILMDSQTLARDWLYDLCAWWNTDTRRRRERMNRI